MMVRHLTRVLDGATLTQADMAECITGVLSGAATTAQIAALLGALRVRGETVEELAGAATAVRAMATRVHVNSPVIVDTCGTGGDGRGTFNISTAAAIVASACGATVAKHGNRSVSSKCGSADVLEALGVRLDLPPDELSKVIALTRLGFLFAPAHHPAFKHVASVRRELGVRTLFNLVGPLANPANANRQVLGVFDPKLAPALAQVLARLGTERALVVHGGGLDEISVCGPTTVCELAHGRVTTWELTPEELGLTRRQEAELAGGDAAHNADIIREVLGGAHGGPRDAVVANAAAALYVAGEVSSLKDGVRRAAMSLDSGAAEAHFERFVRIQSGQQNTLDEIVSKLKVVDAAPRSREPGRLKAALSPRGGPTRVIAEVKRRSPSAGLIAEIPDPGALARQYVTTGAAAISVLTNEAHFGGSIADLAAVRGAVGVPVLRKEFIVDRRQLDEASAAGADAVLLIVAVLGRGLRRMLLTAQSLGLDALVEVHDEAELDVALAAGADLIGVNNRDLRTFKVDLSTTERLAARVPAHVMLVGESGIKGPEDIARLRAHGVSNFLVGEHLVRGGGLT